jgi:hypothetical protein
MFVGAGGLCGAARDSVREALPSAAVEEESANRTRTNDL